jgi:hypothetical protein
MGMEWCPPQLHGDLHRLEPRRPASTLQGRCDLRERGPPPARHEQLGGEATQTLVGALEEADDLHVARRVVAALEQGEQHPPNRRVPLEGHLEHRGVPGPVGVSLDEQDPDRHAAAAPLDADRGVRQEQRQQLDEIGPGERAQGLREGLLRRDVHPGGGLELLLRRLPVHRRDPLPWFPRWPATIAPCGAPPRRWSATLRAPGGTASRPARRSPRPRRRRTRSGPRTRRRWADPPRTRSGRGRGGGTG